jgi:hypothetical protein
VNEKATLLTWNGTHEGQSEKREKKGVKEEEQSHEQVGAGESGTSRTFV